MLWYDLQNLHEMEKRQGFIQKKKKEAQENYVQLLSQDAEIFDVCLEYMWK